MTVLKTNPRTLSTLFDDFLYGFPTTWGKDVATENFNVPAANISETKDGYEVAMNVPGRNKENFKINVENGLLSISYEKIEEAENKDVKTLRREFSFRSFKRSFTLDDKVNADAIQAKYENGILNLFIPKKEEIKIAPKQITIS